LMLALVDTAHAMEKHAAVVRRANGAAAVEAEAPREKTFAVTYTYQQCVSRTSPHKNMNKGRGGRWLLAARWYREEVEWDRGNGESLILEEADAGANCLGTASLLACLSG
jgi:hypothetical protein